MSPFFGVDIDAIVPPAALNEIRDVFNCLVNANTRIRWALRLLEVSPHDHLELRTTLNRAVVQVLEELPWALCEECQAQKYKRTRCLVCNGTGYWTYRDLHPNPAEPHSTDL